MKYSLDLRFLFFFFNDTAPTEIYTLSLHDALPIGFPPPGNATRVASGCSAFHRRIAGSSFSGTVKLDRKSTRLNSSHVSISYAVFCLKKKKRTYTTYHVCTYSAYI